MHEDIGRFTLHLGPGELVREDIFSGEVTVVRVVRVDLAVHEAPGAR